MKRDEGAAGVAMAAVGGVVLLLAVALGAVGMYLATALQAAAAADAAALAAAPVTYLPFGAAGSAADEAARFAAANGARLLRCDCSPDPAPVPRTVEVVVARDVDLPLVGSFSVEAVSRAEFDPTLLEGLVTDPSADPIADP